MIEAINSAADNPEMINDATLGQRIASFVVKRALRDRGHGEGVIAGMLRLGCTSLASQARPSAVRGPKADHHHRVREMTRLLRPAGVSMNSGRARVASMPPSACTEKSATRMISGASAAAASRVNGLKPSKVAMFCAIAMLIIVSAGVSIPAACRPAGPCPMTNNTFGLLDAFDTAAWIDCHVGL